MPLRAVVPERPRWSAAEGAIGNGMAFGRERTLIGYSAGNFGKNLVLSAVDLTLLYLLTDLLGIPAARASALMMIVFFGDLLFDIASGYLASLGRAHGFGYRRMIAVGALPCGAAFALLYSLPLLRISSFAILAAGLLVFRAAYAIIDVPHNALLASVARDSRSRGRASGYRSLFSALASVAIAVVLAPAILAAARSGHAGVVSALGIAGGASFCIALWTAAWSSRPEPGDSAPRHGPIALVPRMDRLAAAMAVIAIVTGFAMPMFGRMMLYLSTYVLDRPALATQILLAITIGQLPGVLLWTCLIHAHEKTSLLATSYLVAALGILLFAGIGNQPIALVGAAMIVGVGLAGVFMLPWGILADVIDFAEFRHGERRETAAFAVILVLLKAGAAASAAVIGHVLGEAGYVPGTRQAAGVIEAMRLLAFGVPLLGCIASVWTLSRMSVGHSRHARVRRLLDARSRGAGRRRTPTPP